MITKISITNCGPFKSREINLPAIALIRGANGSGKTSLQRCLMYPFQSGHEPGLLNTGADSGEIIATLSDGTLLRATLTKNGGGKRKEGKTVREYKPKDGKAWQPSSDYVARIASAISYNPLKDLDAPDKEQLAMLLQVMPIDLGKDELDKAIGEAGKEAPVCSSETDTSNGMARIEYARDAIYDKRTEINRDVLRLTKFAEQLEQALPDEAATDWTAEKARLAAEKSSTEAQRDELLRGARENFHQLEVRAERILAELCSDVDTEIDAKIADLNKQRESRKSDILKEKDEGLADHRSTMEDAIQTANDTFQPLIETFAAQIATAEEKALQVAKSQSTRENADKARNEAAVEQAKSDILTAAIERLDGLKVEVAKRMPIAGIVINQGRICRYEKDGAPVEWGQGEPVEIDWVLVPFSKWNTADKIVFRFRLAVLAASRSECPFVTCDSIGDLDPDTLRDVEASCERYARELNIQWIFGSAEGGDLRITEGLQ